MDYQKQFRGRRKCTSCEEKKLVINVEQWKGTILRVVEKKITETKSSSINENNLPCPGTTSSPDSNSKENQFFPDVSMESFNETGFEETCRKISN